jgi:hypothetical protein
MFYNVLDKRILHVWRVGHGDLLIAIARLQADGLIVEHRETDLTLSTYYFYTVLAGTLVSHIAPRARAWQTILERERGAHRVLCIVVSSTIGTDASSLEDNTKDILTKIELMRSHIIEITTSGNIGL